MTITEPTLTAELVDAYTILASWMARHRMAFPRHTVSAVIECRPDEGERAFQCDLHVGDEDGEELLLVPVFASSPTQAAAKARIEAEEETQKRRRKWLSKGAN